MEKYRLEWEEFNKNFRENFRELRKDETLVDVTLASDDGHQIRAHKIILSAGSRFFSDIFLRSDHNNMLIYLKGVSGAELENIADFIYNGEVSIHQEELDKFLDTGNELKIKGLMGDTHGTPESDPKLQGGKKDKRVNKTKPEYVNEKEVIDHDHMIDEAFSDTIDYPVNSVFKMEKNFTKNEVEGKKFEAVSKTEPEYITEKEMIDQSPDVSSNSKAPNPTVLKMDQSTIKTELDVQIQQMSEREEGMWRCKVCRKTAKTRQHINSHAETHIEGISHACDLCGRACPTRQSLQAHVSRNHSELTNCDSCGKTGFNRQTYNYHKQKNLCKIEFNE